MSNYNSDDYAPSYIVRQFHAILHLDSSLKPVSNDFNISYSSQWNDYSRSLLPVPIICAALGILGIFSLCIALCIRICFKNCRCLPRFAAAGHEEIIDRFALPSYNFLCTLFLFFAVLVVFTNQMSLFGNHYVTEGVDISRDGIDFLSDLTTTLTNQGNDLLTYGDTLETDLDSAGKNCSQATNLANNVYLYDGYVNDYLNYVSPIPGRCSDANNGIDAWEYYKNASLWVLYGIFWIIIALYVFGMFCKQKCVLQISISITHIFMIIVFLIVGVIMVILIGFGDFCMDPLPYTSGLLPRDIYNVTDYYLDCQGSNPLSSDLNSAYEFVDGYYEAITYLLSPVGGCSGNTYLESSLSVLTTINGTLNTITSEIVCPPIQSQLSEVIESGLCVEAFQGFYTIWLGNYMTVSCLFAATILISIIYQYFGQYWVGDVEDNVAVEAEDVQMTHHPAADPGPHEFYAPPVVVQENPIIK